MQLINTRNRRILILVENLPVPLDRRVWLEATTLSANGYEVSVICPTGRGWTEPHEVIDGVHVYRYPEPPEAHSGILAYAREWTSALWHMFRLAARVRRERGFDVIQGCNPPDLLFLIAWRYRLAGVRYVFDHHDVCPELFQAKFDRRGPSYWIMRLLERINFATADVSLATNQSFRDLAIGRGRMRPEDVFVVRSAPRFEEFSVGVADQRYRALGDPLVGYVGVIGQQEGMDLLTAAADHLINVLGRRTAHFLIVGFGPELEAVKADVARRGLSDHFTFTGALYGEEMRAALASTDIGVCPDPKNPMNDISTMNKVMEYMTLEKPVVQFDLKEGRASAGEASVYATDNDPVDFAEKIAHLVDRPDLRRKMGQAGRRRVADALSWEHSIPPLLAAYDRVFSRVGRRATRR